MEKQSRKASVRTPKKTPTKRSLQNLRPPWGKGESGNPGGRPTHKPVLEALHEALTDEPDLIKKIALNALRQASCNLGFFREIRDMLDGKPGPKIEEDPADAATSFDMHVHFIDSPELSSADGNTHLSRLFPAGISPAGSRDDGSNL